jgi:acylphosphatase
MARTVHARITGIVQGVGYRAFVERTAHRLDLAGWVRNRRDGSVEAVFAGEAATIEAMIAACRNGPRMARVDETLVEDIVPDRPLDGFEVLPTE